MGLWVYTIRKFRSGLHPCHWRADYCNQALLFLDNSGLSWTVFAPNKVTAVYARRNGNFQTPISVPAVRPKRCHTLSNPTHRQDYTVACLNYTLQTMMPLPGWPVMAPNAYNNNNDCNCGSTCLEQPSVICQVCFITYGVLSWLEMLISTCNVSHGVSNRSAALISRSIQEKFW